MIIPSSVRDLFAPAPGITYLDAATVGLPPQPTIDALQQALRMWQDGTADWARDWDTEGDRCRELFATLIGANADEIGLVPTVSAGVGIVAASIRENAEVLVPEGEFPSVLYPFLVAEKTRGVRVREAPFATLHEAISPETTLVAFSLTQSQSGKTAPLAEICAAATANGTQVLVDSTHGTPFVSVAEHLPSIDYLACHGYKHLLSPRGAGFLYVRRDRQDEIAPYLANIRSALPTDAVPYGGPLNLRNDAGRFDVTLAWHSWVGARKSLELLVEWQRAGYLADVLNLSARLAAGLGLEPPTSSLVTFAVPDPAAAEAALLAAGVKGAARGRNVRLAPHVYNTEEDVDRAVAAISSVLVPTAAD